VEGILQGKRAFDNYAVLKYEAKWRSEEAAGLPAAVIPEFSTSYEELRSGPLRATKLAVGSVGEALEQAVRCFPEEAKHKAVVLIRDKSLDGDASLEGNWRETALAHGVHMYFVMDARVADEETALWRSAANETEGLLMKVGGDAALPGTLRLVGEALQGSFHLTYALARLGIGGVVQSNLPVHMDVYSEKGYGSLRILEE
jgi:hypothetical protein